MRELSEGVAGCEKTWRDGTVYLARRRNLSLDAKA
jgi:hypothetical protein